MPRVPSGHEAETAKKMKRDAVGSRVPAATGWRLMTSEYVDVPARGGDRRFREKASNLVGPYPGEPSMPQQSSAYAAEIKVLSGAAVEPGLIAAGDIFRKQTGADVKITFATTPEIRRLVAAGATP